MCLCGHLSASRDSDTRRTSPTFFTFFLISSLVAPLQYKTEVALAKVRRVSSPFAKEKNRTGSSKMASTG